MENKFKRVHTASDLAISLVLVIAGVALFFVNKGVGVVIAIIGVGVLLLYKKGYKKEGSDILLKKHDIELNKACKASVVDFLNGKNVEPQLTEGSEGGSVRLVVYYNKAEGLAFAQLFDFRDYEYHAATELVELRRPRVEKLIDKF